MYAVWALGGQLWLVQSRKCSVGRWVGVSRLFPALIAVLPEFEPCLKESCHMYSFVSGYPHFVCQIVPVGTCNCSSYFFIVVWLYILWLSCSLLVCSVMSVRLFPRFGSCEQCCSDVCPSVHVLLDECPVADCASIWQSGHFQRSRYSLIDPPHGCADLRHHQQWVSILGASYHHQGGILKGVPVCLWDFIG